MLAEHVIALVVTSHRAAVPTTLLDAVQAQTVRPGQVIVAENFAAGLTRALAQPCEAVWVIDSRVLPRSTMLAKLLDVRHRYLGDRPRLAPPALVAGSVAGMPSRASEVKFWASRGEKDAAAVVGAAPLRRTPVWSVLLDADRARQVGAPVVEFGETWCALEFTGRTVRGRRGLSCPSAVADRIRVEPETAGHRHVSAPPEDLVAAVRDRVWTLRSSPGLNRPERALLTLTSAGDWARDLLRAPSRMTLAAWVRGLRAGARPTPQALRDVPRLSGPGAAPPSAQDPTLPRRTTPRRDDGFSVLMPFYRGDKPDALELAFRSVTVDQTRRPDQVVLVQDGPVGDDLDRCVGRLIAESVVPVTHVRLPHNVGLGPALTHGLVACDYDIVARMDADDVSLPHRFEVQLALIESGTDVVGASIEEFDGTTDQVVARRDALTDPARIIERARFEQTFNHPVIVYRASLVEAAGGYQNLPYMEDYLLFAGLIQAGARVANVGEPLLRYRVSDGAFARRGGIALLRAEVEVQRRFRALGFTTRGQAVRNLVLRGGYRVTPESVRRTAYRSYHALRRRVRGA